MSLSSLLRSLVTRCAGLSRRRQKRVRNAYHESRRRLLIESLEGRRVLTSGVPFESFDSVIAPNLPANWSVLGNSNWTTVSGLNSHTADNHAFIPNPATASNGSLQSRTFTPTANSSIINFANSYNTEAGFDGGVLEITINGGLPTDILAVGGSFITGGYNSTINSTATGTPLVGRQAWSGNSGGYIATSVQLPPSAIGQTVTLVWRFASDASVPGVGWRIDSITQAGSIKPIDLATLSPTQGTTIFGGSPDDESGKSVSIVGDVNGDGYDDMVIAAPSADTPPSFNNGTGGSYLVFGGQSPWSTVDLFSSGIFFYDSSGNSGKTVAPAGDVNGDGLADFFIGDERKDRNNFTNQDGISYVVFGKTDWSGITDVDLIGLGTGGIKFLGIETEDRSGFSVSTAGDVNGDGFDDMLIGAYKADAANNAKPEAGESYLIFGKADWSSNQTVELTFLGQAPEPSGVTFFGADSGDYSGQSVSGAGDVNGDGYDDFIIGAPRGDGSAGGPNDNFGESYLVFGKPDWTDITTFDLATLEASTGGVKIFGADAGDSSGRSVARVGDINGDGFDDLAIGANLARAFNNTKFYAGESYVLFGKSNWSTTDSVDLASLGTQGITIFGPMPLTLSALDQRWRRSQRRRLR